MSASKETAEAIDEGRIEKEMTGKEARGTRGKTSKSSSVKINSIRKTLQILESICKAKNGLSSSDLAKAHDMSPPLIHHYIKGILEEGYIFQEKSTKKYKANYRIVELGSIVVGNNEIAEMSYSVLSALSEETKSTIHLALREGDLGVCVSKIGNSEAIPSITRVGMSFDLYATALGKAMLAFLGENEVKEYLDRIELIPYTKNTITDPKTLMKELSKIKSQKYSMDNEEHRLGLKAIGMPIFDYKNAIVGAISCPLLPFHTQEDIKSLAQVMYGAAKEISEKMGCKKFENLVR